MLRRYELTDEEWLRIEPLLPPENTENIIKDTIIDPFSESAIDSFP